MGHQIGSRGPRIPDLRPKLRCLSCGLFLLPHMLGKHQGSLVCLRRLRERGGITWEHEQATAERVARAHARLSRGQR